MRTGCIRPQSERSAQVKGVVLLGEMKQVRQLLILQRVAQAPGVALVHAGLAPLQLVEQSMRRGRHRECEQPMGSAGLCSLERESGNLTVVTAIGSCLITLLATSYEDTLPGDDVTTTRRRRDNDATTTSPSTHARQ
jgi:hypothetical protein